MQGSQECEARIEYVALSSLPGGAPVALVEREGHVICYMSEAYDLDTVARALTAVICIEARKAWVHMPNAHATR